MGVGHFRGVLYVITAHAIEIDSGQLQNCTAELSVFNSSFAVCCSCLAALPDDSSSFITTRKLVHEPEEAEKAEHEDKVSHTLTRSKIGWEAK